MNEQILDVATVPQNTAVTRAPDAAMGIDDILAQAKLIQTVMGKVMQEGEHYGKIPGCGNRSTLLQPGAQKLTMTFRLAPEYQIQETNYDRGHKEYRVICTLKSIASGNFVGQGVGCCSTLESKYRWKGGARKCPECGQGELKVRRGKFGYFLGCDRYPECKHIEKIEKKTGVKCQQCGQGELVEKRTRKGRTFWGCSRYPECEYATWKYPETKEQAGP